MIKKSTQINKGTVKNQKKDLIWECLSCRFRVISKVRPTKCACSLANYVINTQYTVGENHGSKYI